MTDEHTPGPWEIAIDVWDPWIRSAATKQNICDALISDNEADYRLIAAAPELLAALKELIKAADFVGSGVVDWAKWLEDASVQARAAIARATGSETREG